MYYNPENKSNEKAINLINEDTKRNSKYILSKNEKENINKSFKSLNNSIKKNSIQLNITFKNNMPKIKESINNVINARQSPYNSNEEKKNNEEKFKFNSRLSDSIIDILFDYTGSKNIKSNSNIVNYNNKGKTRNNHDLNFGPISNKSNDNIIFNENKKLENITNKKINYNYEIDLENQEHINDKEIIYNNTGDNGEENIERNDNVNNDNNEDKNIIINYNKNYSFGNKEIYDNKTDTESAHFNMDTDNININQKKEKEIKEENRSGTQLIKLSNNDNDNGNFHNDNKDNENDNQLNDSDENFYFNYRSDVLFNKINKLDTKMLQKNNDINKQFIPSLIINDNQVDNNLNQFLKINKTKESLYNSNNIKETRNNNLNDTNSNSIESKSSSILIDTLRIKKVNEEEKEIETQIKFEEEKLKKLEKEKNKLINEENERKKLIIDEMNKKKLKKNEMKTAYKQAQKQKMKNEEKLNNIILEQEKRKEEIKELVRQGKKDVEQLISLTNLTMNDNNKEIFTNNNKNNNYCDIDSNDENNCNDFSKRIKIKNGVISKNSLEMVKRKLSNANNPISNSYIDNIIANNKNKNVFDRNESDYNFKKLEKNNYNLSNKEFNNFNLNNNFLFNENKINKKINKKIYNNEINTSNEDNKSYDSKYNTNSFFKFKNKERNLNNNKYDFNNYYNSNTFNERKFTEKNNERNSTKNNPKYLTPNSLYRTKNEEKNDCNKITINSSENDNFDNEDDIKTLTKNKSCYMTQTRFYRTKLNPDQFSSNYAKEKVKTIINNEKNHNSDINLNEYKNKNNKNIYNGINISNSILNSNYNIIPNGNFYKERLNKFNHHNNTCLKNSIYNEILHNNNLYNNNCNKNINDYNNNDININKSKSSKRLNVYRTSCILRKGNSYNDISKSNGINNNRIKDNQKLISFLGSYNRNEKGKSFSDLKNYIISSQTGDNNNGFSMNSLHSDVNDKNKKLCNKCIKKKMINKNEDDICGNSKLKLCSKCQKLYKSNKI